MSDLSNQLRPQGDFHARREVEREARAEAVLLRLGLRLVVSEAVPDGEMLVISPATEDTEMQVVRIVGLGDA